MSLDAMLSAADAASVVGAESVTHIDSSTNITHFVNLIAKVYAKSYPLFKDVQPYDVNDKAIELASGNLVMPMFARRGQVSDGDAVSVIEALRWTGIFATTGRKPKFYPVLIEPIGKVESAPELAAKRDVSLWNAFILDDFQGMDYTDYGKLPGAKVKSINILQQSVDAYDVKLR
jgi:hypothetical protein